MIVDREKGVCNVGDNVPSADESALTATRGLKSYAQKPAVVLADLFAAR
jgi:hypothetical protein